MNGWRMGGMDGQMCNQTDCILNDRKNEEVGSAQRYNVFAWVPGSGRE